MRANINVSDGKLILKVGDEEVMLGVTKGIVHKGDSCNLLCLTLLIPVVVQIVCMSPVVKILKEGA